MALTGTDRGAGNNNVAASSVAITPGSNFAAGSHAVLVLAYDNNGTAGADPYTSIGDSVGNTWIPRQAALYDPGNAAAGITLRVFSCPMLVAALTTSNTITVSFSASTTAKSWALHEVTCAAGSIVRYINSGVNTGAASASPTVNTASITSGDLVIGAGAAESGDTWAGDADVSNGSWSAHQHSAAGTGLTGASVTSQRKVVSGTATQTYNPTLTSADVILAWVQFREVVSSITAGSGSFGITGQTANLRHNKTIVAAAGSFAVSGQAVNLRWHHRITAAAGSFEVTGNNASMAITTTLPAAAGSFAVTGNDVNLRWHHRITAAAGSFAVTGQTINLLRNLRLSAATGAYVITGSDVTLPTIATGYTLQADSGSYSITGRDAGLTIGRRLPAEAGAYALSGSTVDLIRGLVLTAESGVYEIDGFTVELTRGEKVVVRIKSQIFLSINLKSPIDTVRRIKSPITKTITIKSRIQ